MEGERARLLALNIQLSTVVIDDVIPEIVEDVSRSTVTETDKSGLPRGGGVTSTGATFILSNLDDDVSAAVEL